MAYDDQRPFDSCYVADGSLVTLAQNASYEEYETNLTMTSRDVVEVEPSVVEVGLAASIMAACIAATVVGNVLVVMSVFTYRPLRGVQNFYIVSLAVADLAVAILVMPFNVAYYIMGGRWTFGLVFCHVWLTADILTCTASILNLCAIALDRYRAIHDPIGYAQRRTVSRVLLTVAAVWLASALISVPPLVGWNGGADSLYDPVHQRCQLTDAPGFVLYSASGSFYIPLAVMTFVYIKIFLATRRRLRTRARTYATCTTAVGNSLPGSGGQTGNSYSGIPHGATTAACDGVAQPVVGGLVLIADDQQGKEAECSVSSIEDDVEENMVVDKPSTLQIPTISGTDVVNNEKRSHILNVTANTTRKPRGDRNENDADCKLMMASTTFNCLMTSSSAPPRRQRLTPPPPYCLASQTTTEDGAKGQKLSDPPLVTGRNSALVARSPSDTDSCSIIATGTGMTAVRCLAAEKQRQSAAKERRVARTMAVIMAAFVVCWLPFFVMYVAFPFCTWCTDNVSPRAVMFIVWLGYINSTLNPVIYTVFNVDFRRAFKFLLVPQRRRRPSLVKRYANAAPTISGR